MNFLSIFPFAGILVILLMIAVKVHILHKKGIQVRTSQLKYRGKLLFLYPVFLVVLVLWMVALYVKTFSEGSSLFPPLLIDDVIFQPVLYTTGAVLVVMAVVVMGIALVHIRSSLRFGLDINNKTPLITSGIFSYTRNPFFVSLDLFFIGQALTFPGIFFIGMAILALLVIHLFILKEEKHLMKIYGDHYTSYSSKVRRYF